VVSRGHRSLVTWSWAVLALLAAHDLTHLLDDGMDTPLGALALVAIPQWLLLAAVMAIVVRGDPAASRAAALVLGLTVAVGFAAVHLLPFSPAAFWDVHPAAISWVIVWASIAAGLALAALSRSG
jgi:hypothetical protein